MLWMTLPAFEAYFLGEDFIYLGQYRAAGDSFWGGVWRATDGIFFRPVFCAVNLIWMAILPLDPWAHHVRNYVGSVLAVLLLHRVLLRLTTSRYARVIGVGLFAVSKIHLTNIGYINCNDSVVSLLLLLAAVLLWLRHLDSKSTGDYVAAVGLSALAIFTKDYGLVVVALVATIVVVQEVPLREWRQRSRPLLVRMVPMVVLVGVYLALRAAIVTTPPTTSMVYSPKLLWDQTLHKSAVFTSALGNLSITSIAADSATTGAFGVSDWLVEQSPGSEWTSEGIERWQFIAMSVLSLLTLIAARKARGAMLIGVVWIAVYFGPTLLTRNLQMYYMYEPMAGAAVLLAICLDRAGWIVRSLWAPALFLIGFNGHLSNQASLYHWQFATRGTAQIEKPVIDVYRGKPLESITFLSASPDHWRWALAAGGIGPMVPELLHQPGLDVRFISYESVGELEGRVDVENIVVDIDNGMTLYDPAEKPPPPVLVGLEPDFIVSGIGCNVQLSGDSAIAIRARHAAPATVLKLDGRPMATTRASETYLTAVIPKELVAAPGRYTVQLSCWTGESASMVLVVGTDAERASHESQRIQPADRPLRLVDLHPSEVEAGVGFNVQPSGDSAIGVGCENALPGTVIVFDGSPLPTSYGNDGMLTALIKGELLARPRTVEVWLRYGQSESNRLTFTITPGKTD